MVLVQVQGTMMSFLFHSQQPLITAYIVESTAISTEVAGIIIASVVDSVAIAIQLVVVSHLVYDNDIVSASNVSDYIAVAIQLVVASYHINVNDVVSASNVVDSVATTITFIVVSFLICHVVYVHEVVACPGSVECSGMYV